MRTSFAGNGLGSTSNDLRHPDPNVRHLSSGLRLLATHVA